MMKNKDLLLQEFFSFHQQTLTVQQPPLAAPVRQEPLEPAIKVIAARPLPLPALCRYLNQRKIPFEIAKKYCKEVEFELKKRRFFVIGSENKSGEFELRNRRCKGRNSPEK
jgi:hypothetical protein